MNRKNHVGKLGEEVVSYWFCKKINEKYRFSVDFLGAKAELLDFIVHLIDDNGSLFGPYFFVQVKCTETVTKDTESITAAFDADEVAAAIGRKVPVYLIGVESINDDCEKIGVLAIDSLLTGGVSGVPRFFSLKDTTVRLKIYNEVNSFFAGFTPAFKSDVTRAHIAKKSGAGNVK